MKESWKLGGGWAVKVQFGRQNNDPCPVEMRIRVSFVVFFSGKWFILVGMGLRSCEKERLHCFSQW